MTNKLEEINEYLKNCPSGTPIGDILDALEMESDRKTVLNISSAIKLAGYQVERKVKWDSELQCAVTTQHLIK